MEVSLMSMTYPLNKEVNYADRVARWRPLLNWLLTVPLLVWLQILQLGPTRFAVVGWFAIVFSGRLPESFGQLPGGGPAIPMAGLRLPVRLHRQVPRLCGRGRLRGSRRLSSRSVQRPAGKTAETDACCFGSSWSFPKPFCCSSSAVAGYLALVIGWFAVLIIGRWPLDWLRFVLDWMRWLFRVNGYWLLILDDYPPFGLGA